MAYADTDGSTLKAVEETTWNTTPANSANWKTVRAKGWSLKPKIATYESEELSANVDVRDVVLATKNAQVSINGEYSKDATFETFLEHLFRSAFATNVLKGGVLKNKSMTLEELTVGTANEYAAVTGFRADTLSISASIGRPAEFTISGSAGALALGATSAVGTGSVAAAGTNRVLSLADMSSFVIAGDTTTLCVLDLQLTIQNNTREQFGAGSTGLQGIGYGTRRVSGSFTAYFETREQIAKVNGNNYCDLQFVLTDGTNSHTYRLPALKYTDAEKAIGGRSSDVTQKFDFTAKYDATQQTALMITKTP